MKQPINIRQMDAAPGQLQLNGRTQGLSQRPIVTQRGRIRRLIGGVSAGTRELHGAVRGVSSLGVTQPARLGKQSPVEVGQGRDLQLPTNQLIVQSLDIVFQGSETECHPGPSEDR